MHIVRTAVLVLALLTSPLSMAHAATAYDILYNGLCNPLSSVERPACQIYWLNRITYERSRAESHGICLDSCKVFFPVSTSSNYATCKAACDNQRNNMDR